MKLKKLNVLTIFVFIMSSVMFFGCKDSSDKVTSSGTVSTADVYPMVVDANNNDINDYVEQDTHLAEADSSISSINYSKKKNSVRQQLHEFVDANGDGICDYAQNGSHTWHGPGFVDEDGNGICDYYEEGSSRYNHQYGLRYRDQNQNQINDFVEQTWHQGNGHDFIDENGDGICDLAQDGSLTWHGENYVDANNDGVCDDWQSGGKGYGHGRKII